MHNLFFVIVVMAFIFLFLLLLSTKAKITNAVWDVVVSSNSFRRCYGFSILIVWQTSLDWSIVFTGNDHAVFDVFWSKCTKGISSLLCSHSSIFSSSLSPFSHGSSVLVLTASHLVREVHWCESIHQAVFVLETLLSHIQSLLHGHRESDAEWKNEAGQKDDNVDKVNVVRDASGRAHES